MSDKMREEFEAWAGLHWIDCSNGSHGIYNDASTERAWLAWQAARQPQESGEAVAWQRFHNGEWRSCTKSFHDNCLNLAGYGSDDCIYKVRALHPAPSRLTPAVWRSWRKRCACLRAAAVSRWKVSSADTKRIAALESQLAESREREGRMRQALGLVIDLSSKEWQESDGSRKGATDNQGRRLWFISPDVMQAVVAALAAEKGKNDAS